MPIVSDRQLAKYKDTLAKTKSSARRAVAKVKAEHRAGQFIGTMEAVGAAGVVGFLRGKMEKPDGSWFVPGTPIDWELVAGGSLVITGMVGTVLGRYSDDAINAGNGILAHYVGQLGRKMAKEGKFSLIAGAHQLSNPMWHTGELHPVGQYDDLHGALADSMVTAD